MFKIKKVGGLLFFRIGRFGGSFYFTAKKTQKAPKVSAPVNVRLTVVEYNRRLANLKG